MRCIECRKEDMEPGEVEHSLEVAGVRFGGMLKAQVCPGCGESLVSAQELRSHELHVASWLLERHALPVDSEDIGMGASVRFARKALGLKAIELAELVGVAAETVSRWENDERPPGKPVLHLLNSWIIGDQVAGPEYVTRGMLEGRRKRAELAKVPPPAVVRLPLRDVLESSPPAA